MNPIELLQDRLKELQLNLEKSTQMYLTSRISCAKHDLHRENLEPKIAEFKQAIDHLKINNFYEKNDLKPIFTVFPWHKSSEL